MLGIVIGALLGGVVGYVNARVVAGVVIDALERTDRSSTEAERADYRARVRLTWAILHGIFIAGGIAAGVMVVGWLLGT